MLIQQSNYLAHAYRIRKVWGKNALKTKTPTNSIMQFSSITSHIIQDQQNPHHSIFEGSAQI